MKQNNPSRFEILFSAGKEEFSIQNTLFPLTISEVQVWRNGERIPCQTGIGEITVQISPDAPAAWPFQSELRFKTPRSFSEADNIKIEIETLEIGSVIFGNQLLHPAIPEAIHPKRIFDFVHKTLEFNFILDAQDTRSRSSEFRSGFMLQWDSTADSFAQWMDLASGGVREAAVSLIKELRPELLCFPWATSADTALQQQAYLNFLQLCSRFEASPHVIFRLSDMDLSQIPEIIRTGIESVPGKTWWQPQRTWELSLPGSVPAEETRRTALIDRIRSAAEMIKAADPQGILILPGTDPRTEKGRLWNEYLLQTCAHCLDQIGISNVFPGIKGWGGRDDKTAYALSCGLPDEFEALIRSLSAQAAAYSDGRPVKLAVSPWAYFKQPANIPDRYETVYTKQDAFYFASVLNRIYHHTDRIGTAVAGFLFGPMGFIDSADGQYWKTAPFHLFEMMHSRQKIALPPQTVKEKEVPSFTWDGIPGVANPQTIPYVDIHASRSEDGKQLFILVINRHPRKRALVRFDFMNLGMLRPVEATVLRAKRTGDTNTEHRPEAVSRKEIKLRNYRAMDHVNLDIAPSGIGGMLLSE